MFSKYSSKTRKTLSKAYTLIELIVVIAIISILVIISIPSFVGYKEKTKKVVCDFNCLQLEKSYEAYLELNNINHSDSSFNQFRYEYGKSICPDVRAVSYEDEEIRWDLHYSEGEDNGEVPYL